MVGTNAIPETEPTASSLTKTFGNVIYPNTPEWKQTLQNDLQQAALDAINKQTADAAAAAAAAGNKTSQTDMTTLADLYKTLFGQNVVTPASGTGDVQLVPSTTTTSTSMVPVVLIGVVLSVAAYIYYKNKKKKGE